MRARLESVFATLLLGSRWLMAPLCLGLIAALAMVLIEFFRELAHAMVGFAGMGSAQVVLAVLKLIDLVLIANLVLMIIGAAVAIYMPTAPAAADERRDWQRGIDFAALKLKVFGSISAIAAIDLLETFVDIDVVDKRDVVWEILILLAFVVSGVLLAWTDRIAAERR